MGKSAYNTAERRIYRQWVEVGKRTHTSQLTAGIKEYCGYEMSVRQEIAVHRMGLGLAALTAGIPYKESLLIIEDEMEVFLREAGLREPHYKPPGRRPKAMHEKSMWLWRAYDARNIIGELQTAIPEGESWVAAQAAAYITKFVAELWLAAYLPGHAIGVNVTRGRILGGEANIEAMKPHYEEWEKIADQVRKSNRFLTSEIEVARIVARRANPNPRSGKSYNARTVSNQLKKSRK